jgi:hypothetical protein
MIRSLPLTLPRLVPAVALLAAMVSCGPQADTPPKAPAPVQTPAPEVPEAKPAAAPAPAPAKPATQAAAVPTSADDIFNGPPPVELNGFGSDEPVERPDLPARGIVRLSPKDFIHTTMAHWEQYDWTTFKPKRWGRYAVRMTYTLSKASLPLQLRLGEQRLKKTLAAASEPKEVYLGEVYIAQADLAPFALFAPSAGGAPGLDIREMAFIPTRETDEPISAADDGSITLLAKTATTWSETMRYEPKAEKNCLGFWTEVGDFAEWEFVAAKPGRYQVKVTQGCGTGSGGSQVQVRLGTQKLAFTVEDTGGFQNWKEVEAGLIEIKQAGLQRIAIQPMDKKGNAVMDVQKIVLVPAS